MSDYNTSTQTPALTYTFERSAQIRNTSHLIFRSTEGHIVFMVTEEYLLGVIRRGGRLSIVALLQLGNIVSLPNSTYARSALIEHPRTIQNPNSNRQRILLVSASINSLDALSMWPQGLQHYSLDANYITSTLASLRF